jgi:hypothetical protein
MVAARLERLHRRLCLLRRAFVVDTDGARHSTDAEVVRDASCYNIDGVLETIGLRLIALRPRLDTESFELSPPPFPPPQGGREWARQSSFKQMGD